MQGVLITAVGWILDGTGWAAVKLILVSTVLSSTSLVLGGSEVGGSCHGVDLCLRQITVYQLQSGVFNISGNVSCEMEEV